MDRLSPEEADGDVDNRQPQYPQAGESAHHHPRQDQQRPPDEQLVGVGAGLVDLPEHSEEHSDEDRRRRDRRLPGQRRDLFLISSDAAGDDARLNDCQLDQAGHGVPVPGKEADDSGQRESQAEKQQSLFDPRPPGERAVDDSQSVDTSFAAQNAGRVQTVDQLRRRFQFSGRVVGAGFRTRCASFFGVARHAAAPVAKVLSWDSVADSKISRRMFARPGISTDFVGRAELAALRSP